MEKAKKQALKKAELEKKPSEKDNDLKKLKAELSRQQKDLKKDHKTAIRDKVAEMNYQ